MTVLAATADGEEALVLARTLQPDVLLLDLGLPQADGMAVMSALASAAPGVRTLVLSARVDAASVRRSLAMGARGYVAKSGDSDELLRAIRAVAAGGAYLSAEAAAIGTEAEACDPPAGLTQRELEILAAVARGLSSKEIARELGISDLTVRKHRENLCRKLGVRSGPELVARAVRYTGI